MSSPGQVNQPLLVSGTNIKTVNGSSILSSGDIATTVATDAIFDAAGDLIVGTGANTGARLPLGTALQVIQVNAGATTVEYVGTSGTGALARVASPTFTGTVTAGEITASGTVKYAGAQTTEITLTPSGTTQTITLNSGNHQTISLASTSGNPTVTITVPTDSCAGTIIVINHGTTPRSITWAVSSGSIMWMGGAPDFSADAVSTSRVVSWRWNGAVMRLAATEVGV